MVLVIAAVALVGAGGLVGIRLTGGDKSSRPAGPGHTSTSTVEAAGQPSFGLESSPPVSPPPVSPPPVSPPPVSPPPRADDVTFYDFIGGLRLPRSAAAGPAHLDGFLASGFARSRIGSVLAAINIAYRTAGTLGESVWRPTIERQVIGDNRTALLAAAQREGRQDMPGPGERIAGSDSRIIGWQLESYSQDTAMVRYLLLLIQAKGQPLLAAVRVEVRWVDDDWKVVAPSGGDWRNAGSQVTDTAGFRMLAQF
ncbi:hypothetical protein BMG523Draft_04326 [Frankia sp. BMG5.23]|nr:hypothetical protein BMG523Draft_04326 [Frankia sp. BMG5.23]